MEVPQMDDLGVPPFEETSILEIDIFKNGKYSYNTGKSSVNGWLLQSAVEVNKMGIAMVKHHHKLRYDPHIYGDISTCNWNYTSK